MSLFLWPRLRLGIISVLVISVVATVFGCGGDDDTASNGEGKIKVVATLPLFADFVRQIGGDRVEVTSLVPAGADPHTWEPSPSDVQRVAEADVAFANGMGLEPAAINLVETNLREGVPLVILSDLPNRPPCTLGCILESVGKPRNPHLWMYIGGGVDYAGLVAASLSMLDPEAAASYDANRKAYFTELESTFGYVQSRLQPIPARNRKLITTHSAFEYFAGGFGLEFVASVTEGPGNEPTPEDVANLARAIEREGVPAVFVEPQISAESDILRQAAEDAGVEICTLYSDSLDDKVTSYVELMRFNADELARCLGVEG